LAAFNAGSRLSGAFVTIVAAVFGWLLWLAGRDCCPGTGPDLTHHLLLIGYMSSTGACRTPALGAYSGRWWTTRPAVICCAALAGAWTNTDGLHSVYPLVAFTVAAEVRLVFLIARRLVSATCEDRVRGDGCPAAPAPRAYFIGSFAQHSFLAQVCRSVSRWRSGGADRLGRNGRRRCARLFALFGAATFLTWPV